MPIFAYSCHVCGTNYEKLLKTWRDDDPDCPKCSLRLRRKISAPHVINSAPLSVYATGSSYDSSQDSHVAYAKNTPDGVPRKVIIDSRQKQIEFCKSEGLYDPHEMPSNITPDHDGKVSTRGISGQWI